MTNSEKFKEVFGFLPDIDQCIAPKTVCEEQKKKYPIEEMCLKCPFHRWWEKEYLGCFKLKETYEKCVYNCHCPYGKKEN